MKQDKVILTELQFSKMVSNAIRKALNEAMNDTFPYGELSSQNSFGAMDIIRLANLGMVQRD